jgi:hypothetical protein
VASAGPDLPDQAQLAHEFTREMYARYRYLRRTLNYRANSFQALVANHGGVGAAKLFLRDRNASDGFTRLCEEGMLEYTVQAAVLKPKYESLFTAEEREAARRRLELHGFDVASFLNQVDTTTAEDSPKFIQDSAQRRNFE